MKYSGEEDKCYGITGMAIGMMIWDSENQLSGISLDASGDEAVVFTPDFYFAGNPQISAKAVWNKNLEHFQLTVGLLLSNVMCRCHVMKHSKVGRDLKDSLLRLVKEEGQDYCSLESDEIERLFEKNFEYLNRIFSHKGVQGIADQFAKRLKKRRRLSQSEIIEQLRQLGDL